MFSIPGIEITLPYGIPDKDRDCQNLAGDIESLD